MQDDSLRVIYAPLFSMMPMSAMPAMPICWYVFVLMARGATPIIVIRLLMMLLFTDALSMPAPPCQREDIERDADACRAATPRYATISVPPQRRDDERARCRCYDADVTRGEDGVMRCYAIRRDERADCQRCAPMPRADATTPRCAVPQDDAADWWCCKMLPPQRCMLLCRALMMLRQTIRCCAMIKAMPRLAAASAPGAWLATRALMLSVTLRAMIDADARWYAAPLFTRERGAGVTMRDATHWYACYARRVTLRACWYWWRCWWCARAPASRRVAADDAMMMRASDEDDSVTRVTRHRRAMRCWRWYYYARWWW